MEICWTGKNTNGLKLQAGPIGEKKGGALGSAHPVGLGPFQWTVAGLGEGRMQAWRASGEKAGSGSRSIAAGRGQRTRASAHPPVGEAEDGVEDHWRGSCGSPARCRCGRPWTMVTWLTKRQGTSWRWPCSRSTGKRAASQAHGRTRPRLSLEVSGGVELDGGDGAERLEQGEAMEGSYKAMAC